MLIHINCVAFCTSRQVLVECVVSKCAFFNPCSQTNYIDYWPAWVMWWGWLGWSLLTGCYVHCVKRHSKRINHLLLIYGQQMTVVSCGHNYGVNTLIGWMYTVVANGDMPTVPCHPTQTCIQIILTLSNVE